jgi:Mg2+-importing ATPase
MVAVTTGPHTAFGAIAGRLAEREPETAFERGMRGIATLITRLVVLLVLFVFLVNILLKRDPLESFLFAVALAIGLTPELLPMITSVTLAHGAVRMARKQVIVKRLPAIENVGSMDILCSDKTGTLTEGAVALERAVDPLGNPNPAVLRLAALNSGFETGIASPLDAAVLHVAVPPDGFAKIDEIPFDAVRRMLSVVVQDPATGERTLIAKGAPEQVIAACSRWRADRAPASLDPSARHQIDATFASLSGAGLRTLAVATKPVALAERYRRADEADLILEGFLAFNDPPKPDAGAAIRDLAADGIRVVILTGDNDLVAHNVCGAIGIDPGTIVLGSELDRVSDAALGALAERTTVFARVTPEQKNRVIRALRGRGHVVGFLGDGVNDAPSLHSADVGISVTNATDVAREAADLILLERDLRVLHDGVVEGRQSFGNIMKYLLMGLSSDFGNVLGMAGATLLLPFLPMLPFQVLLNDLLYSASQVTLPIDRVDLDYARKPKHWDLRFIQHFMLVFGPLSSAFDFLTFFVMLRLFLASETLFHTGWFVESLATQTLVVFVIRTTGNPLRSRPSRALVASTLACVGIGVLLPFTPLASILGFVRPPADFFGFLTLVLVVYLVLAQAAKRWFYRRYAFAS